MTSYSYFVLMIITNHRPWRFHVFDCFSKVSGTQFMGRTAASPSNANFDTTRSPLPYSNSPQSAGMLNAPSPQQQQQQQQRSKLMQLPQHQHQQQLLAQQQQLRQSSMQQVGFNVCLHTSIVLHLL